MAQYNVLEARDHLSSLVVRAVRGEEVVIANRGVPQVRLVPMTAPAQPGDGGVVAAWFQDHHLSSGTRQRGEIDADLEAERSSWA
jgi:prevent-host-death family protein